MRNNVPEAPLISIPDRDYCEWLRTAACFSMALLVRIVAIPFAPFSSTCWRLYFTKLFPMNLRQTLRMGYRRKLKHEFAIWRFFDKQPPRVKNLVSVTGSENLDEALTSGRGILVVTVHTTYFRVLQYWLGQEKESYHPYLLKHFPRSSRNETPDEWRVHEHQLKIFDGRILNAFTTSGIRNVVEILKQGGIILICQDDPSGRESPVSLFGRKVSITLGAARLAELSGALIIPAALTGQLWGRPWRLRFWEPIDPRQGSTRLLLVSALERILTAVPEVWVYWRYLLNAPLWTNEDSLRTGDGG